MNINIHLSQYRGESTNIYQLVNISYRYSKEIVGCGFINVLPLGYMKLGVGGYIWCLNMDIVGVEKENCIYGLDGE